MKITNCNGEEVEALTPVGISMYQCLCVYTLALGSPECQKIIGVDTNIENLEKMIDKLRSDPGECFTIEKWEVKTLIREWKF